MQYIRGYLSFEETQINTMETKLNTFRLNQSEIFFFDQITINQKTIEQPGVLVDGNIKKEYTTYDIIKTFRKIMNLEVLICNCDISLESEDELIKITKGNIQGVFYSFHFVNNNDNEKPTKEAQFLSKKYNSKNTVLRTLGVKNKWGLDLVCETPVDTVGVSKYLEQHNHEILSVSNFNIK